MTEEMKLITALCTALGFDVVKQDVFIDEIMDISKIDEMPNKMTIDEAIELLNKKGFNWVKLENGDVVDRSVEQSYKLVPISSRAK